MNEARGRDAIDVDILRMLFNFVVYMLQQGVDRVWASAIQLTWVFPLLLALSSLGGEGGKARTKQQKKKNVRCGAGASRTRAAVAENGF